MARSAQSSIEEIGEPELLQPEADGLQKKDLFAGASLHRLGVIAVALAFFGFLLGKLTSPEYGWILFGIGLLAVMFWSAVRNPPPPRDPKDADAAAINFGR